MWPESPLSNPPAPWDSGLRSVHIQDKSLILLETWGPASGGNEGDSRALSASPIASGLRMFVAEEQGALWGHLDVGTLVRAASVRWRKDQTTVTIAASGDRRASGKI